MNRKQVSNLASARVFLAMQLALCGPAAMAQSQIKSFSRKPAQATPPAGETETEQPAGFVSKKTGKSMASSEIEDINNENFPDMIESFDYPNADIADVVKAISELTGKNFIVDPAVHGKISIIAPSRITVAEAYKAFLSALAINALAVVPGDGFYKIRQARAAQRDRIDTFSGAYYPTADQMITRIIKLKYISAEEVNKQLRILTSVNGELVPYTPTNSLIVSDYGANMDRIMKILEQLDVQGFEEQMEVIRVKFARAKDISELVDTIINKGEKKQGNFGGVPRFRPAGADSGGSSGAEVYSVVVPDDRTNSIIVVGNKAGIEKIRKLISRLDYPMRPDEQGGAYVYHLRHAEAEPMANILNGIAAESKKAQDQAAGPRIGMNPAMGPGGMIQTGSSATAIFGGEVKISADKSTNSLVIVASKQDYDTVKSLVDKLDKAKDQVFIKAIIMEMNSSNTDNWSINVYKFDQDSKGIGRMGFRGSDDVDTLINPAKDSGGILGFGKGDMVDINIGGKDFKVPSLLAFINILKKDGRSNVLSTPQVMALNNEEALIEVGEVVPVSKNDSTGSSGVATSSITREPVTTKLTITPYISPDTDSLKLKIDQDVAGIVNVPLLAGASELAKNSLATSKRKIKTNILLNSGDTAVLGGLMKDEDREDITKVPILGDIPILGWLFKSQSKSKVKSNLMVFITPRIIRSPSDGAVILEEKLNERIDFIQRNMSGRDPHGRYIDDLTRPKKVAKPKAESPAAETF